MLSAGVNVEALGKLGGVTIGGEKKLEEGQSSSSSQ